MNVRFLFFALLIVGLTACHSGDHDQDGHAGQDQAADRSHDEGSEQNYAEDDSHGSGDQTAAPQTEAYYGDSESPEIIGAQPEDHRHAHDGDDHGHDHEADDHGHEHDDSDHDHGGEESDHDHDH